MSRPVLLFTLVLLAVVVGSGYYMFTKYNEKPPDAELQDHVGDMVNLRAGTWLATTPEKLTELNGFVQDKLNGEIERMVSRHEALEVTEAHKGFAVVGVEAGLLKYKPSLAREDEVYVGPTSVIEQVTMSANHSNTP